MSHILDLLPGLALTFGIWAAIVAIGFPLGLVLGYAIVLSPTAVRIPVLALVNLARGFPGLVTLYFFYSGLPSIGILLSSTAAIVAAFAFTTAGYTAGIFRAAIESVPKAQREAASALGLGFWTQQRLVILPQALRTVAGPLVGFSVVVLQATSLGYAIGIRELTGLAYNLGSVTFDALRYMVAAGVVYLVACLLIARIAARIQRTSPRRMRRADVVAPQPSPIPAPENRMELRP